MAEETGAGGFAVAAGAACLDGHFPGNPLVPGVVLLDEALARVGAALGMGAPVRLASAKFLAPVRPGQAVAVGYRETAGGVAFACRVEGAVVASGLAVLAP